MQWLVQVRDLAGNIKWVSITAPDEATARTIGTQNGWIADSNVWHKNAIPTDILESVGPDADINDFQTFGTLGAGQGGGVFNPSDIDQSLMREEFEFGPGFEAGLRGRGINIGPGGGLQGRMAQNRQRALEDRFYTQQALTPGSDLTTETAHPTFQRFLSERTGGGDTFTNPLFGQAGAQAARDLLDQARGFGTATMNFPSLLAGRVLNPATTGEGQILANVALDAGRRRFGSLSRFLPNAEALSQSFLSQDRPMPGTFADYLNTRIFG